MLALQAPLPQAIPMPVKVYDPFILGKADVNFVPPPFVEVLKPLPASNNSQVVPSVNGESREVGLVLVFVI